VTPLEIAAVVTTLVSVILTVRQNIWCWPTGIVGVVLYAVVFWQSRLYSDMGLQFVYLVLSVYGRYEWLHGGEGRSELHVTRAPRRLLGICIVIGIAFAALSGYVLSRTTNAALPWLDSTLTSFSLVAQWLMTKKHLENWIFWIAVDIVYVGMYAYKELMLTAVLYALFLVLAWRGYVQWRDSQSPVTA
jgi:nicotinamide mononucleotide transporter